MPDTPSQSQVLDLLMPLHFVYSAEGLELPEVTFLPGEELPEPARYLLVHESDMTPRLRAFHLSDITLRVVKAECAPEYVMREVVLRAGETGAPVEYGAIGIKLDGFPEHVRELIKAGGRPLGGILEEEGIPHVSAPRGWFSLMADERIAGLLECEPKRVLYGRCNVLSHPDGMAFADIVEVLP